MQCTLRSSSRTQNFLASPYSPGSNLIRTSEMLLSRCDKERQYPPAASVLACKTYHGGLTSLTAELDASRKSVQIVMDLTRFRGVSPFLKHWRFWCTCEVASSLEKAISYPTVALKGTFMLQEHANAFNFIFLYLRKWLNALGYALPFFCFAVHMRACRSDHYPLQYRL